MGSKGSDSRRQSLVDALRVANVSLDLEETLKTILDGLKSIIDYDATAICVVEPHSGQLRSQIVRGYPDEVIKFERCQTEGTSWGFAGWTNYPVRLECIG